jgi:CRISPR/Cas system-associated exonuclease Cas4 (RecB family)
MLLTHLTQASLQDYMDCPRRFKLRYLDRFSYPAEESEPALENERHMREGEYFHLLVQQSLSGMPAGKLGALAVSPELSRWLENWHVFSAAAGLSGLHELHPEMVLSAPLGMFRLLAKYDLIVRQQEGHFVIYDWKTYRKLPRQEWLAGRMQTRVYRALLVQAGAQFNQGRLIEPEQVEMVYWFADFPAEPARFPYSQAAFDHDWDALLTLASEIASASEFPLADDVALCGFCRYRSYCDRGIRAGQADILETELVWQELNLEHIQEIEF